MIDKMELPHAHPRRYRRNRANFLTPTSPWKAAERFAALPASRSSSKPRYSALCLRNGASIGRYVVIKPELPECFTNSGFLWFGNEYTVDDAAAWVLETNAASAIINEGRGLSRL